MVSTTSTKAPSYAGVVLVRGDARECWAAPTAPLAAADMRTGLPVAARLRRLGTGIPMTGLLVGAGTTSSNQFHSDTPGDLPPRDPLS